MTARRAALALIAVALVAGAVAPSAGAHATLLRSEPADASSLAKPPERVQLWFSGALAPSASAVAAPRRGREGGRGHAARPLGRARGEGGARAPAPRARRLHPRLARALRRRPAPRRGHDLVRRRHARGTPPPSGTRPPQLRASTSSCGGSVCCAWPESPAGSPWRWSCSARSGSVGAGSRCARRWNERMHGRSAWRPSAPPVRS